MSLVTDWILGFSIRRCVGGEGGRAALFLGLRDQ